MLPRLCVKVVGIDSRRRRRTLHERAERNPVAKTPTKMEPLRARGSRHGREQRHGRRRAPGFRHVLRRSGDEGEAHVWLDVEINRQSALASEARKVKEQPRSSATLSADFGRGFALSLSLSRARAAVCSLSPFRDEADARVEVEVVVAAAAGRQQQEQFCCCCCSSTVVVDRRRFRRSSTDNGNAEEQETLDPDQTLSCLQIQTHIQIALPLLPQCHGLPLPPGALLQPQDHPHGAREKLHLALRAAAGPGTQQRDGQRAHDGDQTRRDRGALGARARGPDGRVRAAPERDRGARGAHRAAYFRLRAQVLHG